MIEWAESARSYWPNLHEKFSTQPFLFQSTQHKDSRLRYRLGEKTDAAAVVTVIAVAVVAINSNSSNSDSN